MNFVDFITVIGTGEKAEQYGVYPKSVSRAGDSIAFMADSGGRRVLVVTGAVRYGFEGESGQEGNVEYLVCELTHKNAAALRKLFLFTAPTAVLGNRCTIGVGDRLGIATPGHLKVFEEYDAIPVLAQQSMRELTLTGRTYQDVLDSVTFAVFAEGYRRGFGADGDHLKNAQDIANALSIGYTMITLDASDHINGDAATMPAQDVIGSVNLDKAVSERYLGRAIGLQGGTELRFDEAELKRVVLIYNEAVSYAAYIFDSYISKNKTPVDFEISIDETATPTTPLAHFYVANELKLRGVKFATLAPRFCGEFQKGVDYTGDLAQFTLELEAHCAIAKYFGYKLSVHSGSDKFSVFPIIGEKTGGMFHLKTAGTNWLEAMKVVAMRDPRLYRRVHAFALERFDEARQYYHVTTDLAKIPSLDSLSDEQLPELFNGNDARQLIHITYGLILSEKNEQGGFIFRDALYKLWDEHKQDYAQALKEHIGRHLQTLGVPKRVR